MANMDVQTILDGFELSPEQRAAAMTHHVDVAVTAGAGTGKTRTLVARYIALLAADPSLTPRRIFAVTFTRKAAREMRNRIRKELAMLALQDEGAAERWQSCLVELDASRIGTIHMLCADILRNHPAEATLDPDFVVLDEQQAILLKSDAVDVALAWAMAVPSQRDLLDLLDESELRQLLVQLLGDRSRAARAIDQMRRPDMVGFWQGCLNTYAERGYAAGSELNDRDRACALAMPALCDLFDVALAAYDDAKRLRSALDFDDLEAHADALLETNAAVRDFWRDEARALLVDEFQDTNDLQCRLVHHLCDAPGRLFIVGDEKQSIYAFRGADVTVFRREKQRIAARGGLGVDLKTSYRAHPALLATMNRVLGAVLEQQEVADKPWVTPFAALDAPPLTSPAIGRSPYLEFLLAVGNKDEGLPAAARLLVDRIQQMAGEWKGFRYSQVAILCRKISAFAYYEDALNEAGIPYVTVSGKGFYERPEVRDLLNALRAIEDPLDSLTLAGLLRSPSVGLSDVSLFQMSQRRQSAGDTLWEAIQHGACPDAPEQQERLMLAVDLVDNLHARAGREPVADILKDFIDRTGYRAAVRRAGLPRALSNISKLLADIHKSEALSISRFLEYAERIRSSGAREGEARAEAGDAVQIMTIHAAKGLEFPVVVLGDAAGGGSTRPRPFINEELGVLLPSTGKTAPAGKGNGKGKGQKPERPQCYELAKALAGEREDAEAKRFMYVALTRAQQMLIVSGTTKNLKERMQFANWLGTLATAAGLGQHAPGRVEETSFWGPVEWAIDGSAVKVGAFIQGGTRLPPEHTCAGRAAALSPVLDEPMLEPLPSTKPERDDGKTPSQPGRVWTVVTDRDGRAPAWIVGNIVHEAIAAWRGTGEGFDEWAMARAREAGLTDSSQLRDAANHSRRLLDRLHTHPLYAEMATAERRLHEIPFSRQVNGQTLSGRIDILYCRDEVWTVLDFKTDRLRDEAELARVLKDEDYIEQLQTYGAAVEAVLSVRPRLRLCFLDYAGGILLRDFENAA